MIDSSFIPHPSSLVSERALLWHGTDLPAAPRAVQAGEEVAA